MADNYHYRLCFDIKVKGKGDEETDLWLENTEERPVVLNNVIYHMTLKEITFNRKIYQPGEIEAEILFVENIIIYLLIIMEMYFHGEMLNMDN